MHFKIDFIDVGIIRYHFYNFSSCLVCILMGTIGSRGGNILEGSNLCFFVIFFVFGGLSNFGPATS